MCGIACIIEKHADRIVDADCLGRMNHVLQHRGPDDCGERVMGRVGLAFRRLSIIDVSASGHQPMSDGTGRYWIVFNGEIYNYVELADTLRQKGHTFRTQSDTEVILESYKEWGNECVTRFNGMWGFVLYDTQEDIVFCSRDRFGVKPFYYYQNDERFLCASEIKALIASGKVPVSENYRRSFELVALGYTDTTDETLFAAILSLRPGHSLLIDRNGNIRQKQYWRMPEDVRDMPFEEASREFKQLFFDSVKLRLRSDVPVAALLSGGQDSSAIVCSVSESRRSRAESRSGSEPFVTFSSVYDDPRFDEREYIEAVVRHTGVKAHFVQPLIPNLTEDLKKIIWHNDEPLQNSNHFAHWELMKGVAAHGIKVVLSGQGADEILAGYDRQLVGPMLAERIFSGKLVAALDEFHVARERFGFSAGYTLAQFMKTLVPPTLWPGFKAIGLERATTLYRLPYVFQMSDAYKPLYNGRPRQRTTLLNSFFQNSLPRILHSEDRTSMAFSIEQRFPFLDYRLVEFCFSLPDSYKLHRGETKRVMRAAMSDILPREVRQRSSKIGFATPTTAWTKELLTSPYVRELMSRTSPAGVSPEKLRRLMTDPSITNDHVGGFLWRFVNYLVWRDVFNIAGDNITTMSA